LLKFNGNHHWLSLSYRSTLFALAGKTTATFLVARLAILLGLSFFIFERDSLIITMALQHLDITIDRRIIFTISNILPIIPSTTNWKANHVNSTNTFLYLPSKLLESVFAGTKATMEGCDGPQSM